MKKEQGLTKLSELQASLVLAGIISLVIIGLSCIGFFFNQPGWTIGAVIGAVIEIVYLILVDKGSSLALKESKTSLSLMLYFVRMILLVGIFAVLVLLQYSLKVEAFYNSCWGMIIAFAPSTLITVVIQTKYAKGK